MANYHKKKIIFKGGGSAGHVTPNLALIQELRDKSWYVYYIGSKDGLEKSILHKVVPIVPYFSVPTGKFRRYFSLKNFLDPLKIFAGILKAYFLCRKIKPNIVFSKGGFVAFPVVVAAKLCGIPVIIHESDFSPGLANRLSFPFANKICVSFAETEKYLSTKNKAKLIISGTPIRKELFCGNRDTGLKICNFNEQKKVILVQGGGLGADSVNKIIREALPELLPNLQIVHIVGNGKIDRRVEMAGYVQFEYLNEELPHVLKLADMVISRAGANSVHELIALQKPHILLPLGKGSRGDQLLNAKYYAGLGVSSVIYPDNLNVGNLLKEIYNLHDHLGEIRTALKKLPSLNSASIIYNIIETLI